MRCISLGKQRPSIHLLLPALTILVASFVGGCQRTEQFADSTALHHAARKRDFKTCKYLLDSGAEVDARDEKGQTPLFKLFGPWAILPHTNFDASTPETAFQVLELLLKNGADPDAVAKEGASHTDEPASKVVKPVVASASVHHIARRHQVDRCRICNQSIEDVIPFNDVIRRERRQFGDKVTMPAVGISGI